MYWYYAPRTTEELGQIATKLERDKAERPKVDIFYILLPWELAKQMEAENHPLRRRLDKLMDHDKLRYYACSPDRPSRLIGDRYWNSAGVAVAVVAVLGAGGGPDWAAYIGGTTETRSEWTAYKHVMEHGVKLSRSIAQAFFPNIANPYRP